jgi:hypothetical protein
MGPTQTKIKLEFLIARGARMPKTQFQSSAPVGHLEARLNDV